MAFPACGQSSRTLGFSLPWPPEVWDSVATHRESCLPVDGEGLGSPGAASCLPQEGCGRPEVPAGEGPGRAASPLKSYASLYERLFPGTGAIASIRFQRGAWPSEGLRSNQENPTLALSLVRYLTPNPRVLIGKMGYSPCPPRNAQGHSPAFQP